MQRPLQCILFGIMEDFYLDLSMVKEYFTDVIPIHDAKIDIEKIFQAVMESRGAHTYPSLCFLHLADRRGCHAWQLFQEFREKFKQTDPCPFFVLLTHEEYLPFHASLLPCDGTLAVMTRSEFENDREKMEALLLRYFQILSLTNPDDLFLPSTFHKVWGILRPDFEAHALPRQNRYDTPALMKEYLEKGVTLPCFNIKTPSMIAPLIKTAEKTGSPVILEVSPSEVIRYYPHASSQVIGLQAAREQLFTGLLRLRTIVDQEIDRLQPTVPIFLHLDHAASPEIILYCMDIGYDMVMYDGTHRSFNSNLRTSKILAAEAHRRGIVFEAEFSSVDRAVSKTSSAERAAEFLELTNADLLGVSIGQKHGSDYAFEKLLYEHCQIAYRQQTLTDGQGLLVLESIEEILKEKKSVIDEEQRCLLTDLRKHLITAGEPTAFPELYPLQAHPYPFYRQNTHSLLALELWKRTLSKQQQTIQDMELSFHQLIDISFKMDSASISRQIDWIGLREIQQAMAKKSLSPRGLVVHGGSSIDVRNLERLHREGVAKINFGSKVFKNFLYILHERHRPRIHGFPDYMDAMPLSMLRKLLEIDWKDYDSAQESSAESEDAPFIDYLERFYFYPLLTPPRKVPFRNDHSPPLVESIHLLNEAAVNT